MLVSFNALYRLMIFLFIPGCFLNVKGYFLIIGDTDVLLTLLISFAVASFTLYVLQGLSTN